MTTEEEVVALVARKTGISVAKITPEKTFYQLGIDGDDAVELIDELCERYKVPVEGVDLRRYIGPEASFGVISQIFNALTRKSHVEPEEQERDTHQERQHDHDDLTVATTESLHFV